MRKEIIEQLFGNSEATFYRWKKEKRPIIELIEKYFNETEIEDFIETKKISRLETFEQLGLNSYPKLLSIYNFKNIESEGNIKGASSIFADFLIYANEINDDFENIKYNYIAEKTYLPTDYKVEFMRNNQIDANLVIPFMSDLKNNLPIVIQQIKRESRKYQIVEYIYEFVAPIIDMKYNNRFDDYEEEFTAHICNMYNLKSTDDRGYIDEGRKDISKDMVIDAIDSYIYQIKNKGKSND